MNRHPSGPDSEFTAEDLLKQKAEEVFLLLEEELPRKVKSGEVVTVSAAKTNRRLAWVIAEWKDAVSELITQIARATWKDDVRPNSRYYRLSVKLTNALNPPQGLSLYWEAEDAHMWYRAYYSVELLLDADNKPQAFQVECQQPGYLLQARPSLTDLKAALLHAFDLGPLRELQRRPRPGMKV
jgi:hypothetical protein